jgi:hypothetical protein
LVLSSPTAFAALGFIVQDKQKDEYEKNPDKIRTVLFEVFSKGSEEYYCFGSA